MSALTFAVLLTVLMFTRIEGLVCFVMAFPLVFPLYWAGYFGTRRALDSWRDRGRTAMVSLVPLLSLATLAAARDVPVAEVRTQTTTIEIDAPPERIWPYLFRMDAIPPPGSPLFRAGVAHPLRIASSGTEVGSLRRCVLSTGTMPETITVSEPARRMRFRVLETPPAMRELNPFGPVNAAHLRGYFTVGTGEFRLIPLGNGRTRLVGTSTYSLEIYPAAYWTLWSDHIVNGVHLAVMGEMKRRVESRAHSGTNRGG